MLALTVASKFSVVLAVTTVALIPESDLIGGVELDAVTFLYKVCEEVEGLGDSSSALDMVVNAEGFAGSTFVLEDFDVGGITSFVADAVCFRKDAGCGVLSSEVDSSIEAIVLIPAMGFVDITLVPQSITIKTLNLVQFLDQENFHQLCAIKVLHNDIQFTWCLT